MCHIQHMCIRFLFFLSPSPTQRVQLLRIADCPTCVMHLFNRPTCTMMPTQHRSWLCSIHASPDLQVRFFFLIFLVFDFTQPTVPSPPQSPAQFLVRDPSCSFSVFLRSHCPYVWLLVTMRLFVLRRSLVCSSLERWFSGSIRRRERQVIVRSRDFSLK